MAIKQFYPEISPSLNLDFANSKTVDPRITFTRASTATYYDGKTVAKAEENLLLYSQEFDNARWEKTGTTVTVNGAVAPDGTSTADTITATASTGAHRVVQSHASQYYIVSVFAKAGTHSFLQISGNQSLGFFANFDLTLGTVGTIGAGTNAATITSVSNGWYRCTAYFFASPDTGKSFQLVSSASATYSESWTAAGTETIYLWGAQLEQRDTVTAYTPTTSQPITRYQPVLLTAPANTPRIDHDPITGECKGLLVEGQRTNLLTRSEEFNTTSGGAWNNNLYSNWSVATVSANTAIAPDGTLSADTFLLRSNVNNRTQMVTGVAASTSYTLSMFVRSASPNNNYGVGLFLRIATGNSGTIVNPSAATLRIDTELSTTEWKRVSLSYTTPSSGVNELSVGIGGAGSGVTPNADVYIWGAQLETGSRLSSYIKTEAIQVTRAAESVSTSLGQVGQGTFYVNSTVVSGNTLITSGSTTFAATASTEQKTAVAYDASSTRRSINGSAVTSAAGSLGGSSISIAPSANGYIKKMSLYPQKLSDTNLVALAT